MHWLPLFIICAKYHFRTEKYTLAFNDALKNRTTVVTAIKLLQLQRSILGMSILVKIIYFVEIILIWYWIIAKSCSLFLQTVNWAKIHCNNDGRCEFYQNVMQVSRVKSNVENLKFFEVFTHIYLPLPGFFTSGHVSAHNRPWISYRKSL
mgnify:CR=1 FL=1